MFTYLRRSWLLVSRFSLRFVKFEGIFKKGWQMRHGCHIFVAMTRYSILSGSWWMHPIKWASWGQHSWCLLVHYITNTTSMVLWWPVSEMDWFPSPGNKSDRASIKRSLLCLLQSNKWASLTFGGPCMSSLFSKQRLSAFKKTIRPLLLLRKFYVVEKLQ